MTIPKRTQYNAFCKVSALRTLKIGLRFASALAGSKKMTDANLRQHFSYKEQGE